MTRLQLFRAMAIACLAGFACTTTMGPDSDEVTDCNSAAGAIAQCAEVPDSFFHYCAENPDMATVLAAAACEPSDETADASDACFNFNFECWGDDICRPIDAFEDNQKCTPPAPAGEFCDDDDDCAGGLACIGESFVNFWSAGRCARRLQVDERCILFDFECDEGLVCRPTTGNLKDKFCLPPGGEDRRCDDESDCSEGLVCIGLDWNLSDPEYSGACDSLVIDGERCFNFNFECADGLVCRPIREHCDRGLGCTETDQFCQPPGRRGTPCDDDDDCESGECLGEDFIGYYSAGICS